MSISALIRIADKITPKVISKVELHTVAKRYFQSQIFLSYH